MSRSLSYTTTASPSPSFGGEAFEDRHRSARGSKQDRKKSDSSHHQTLFWIRLYNRKSTLGKHSLNSPVQSGRASMRRELAFTGSDSSKGTAFYLDRVPCDDIYHVSTSAARRYIHSEWPSMIVIISLGINLLCQELLWRQIMPMFHKTLFPPIIVSGCTVGLHLDASSIRRLPVIDRIFPDSTS